MAAAPQLLEALIEARNQLQDKIRIAYNIAGADDEMADKLAALEIEKYLLFNAINKATL